MATLAREILTADQMDIRISVLGMSYVGIRVAGTWAGSVAFSASQSDFGNNGPGGGSNFRPVSVYTPANGPTVPNAAQNVTANATWYWPVQNYATFRATFTRTSGSALVTLAASIDTSYADAFLDSGGKFINSFANGTQNLLTIPADANFGKRLRSLVVSAAPHVGGGSGTGSSSSAGPASAGWASNPVLRILDGSTVLFSLDLPNALPFQYTVPLPLKQTEQYGVTDGGIYFTPGNVGSIVLSSGGSGVCTNLNGELVSA